MDKWKSQVLQAIGTLIAFSGLTWNMVNPLVSNLNLLTVQVATLSTKMDNERSAVDRLERRISQLEDRERERERPRNTYP